MTPKVPTRAELVALLHRVAEANRSRSGDEHARCLLAGQYADALASVDEKQLVQRAAQVFTANGKNLLTGEVNIDAGMRAALRAVGLIGEAGR